MATLLQIQKMLDRRKHKLFRCQGVIAVGIGYKIKAGKKTTELALVCSVKEKWELSELNKNDVIPQTLNGIKTDVIEVGTIKALHIKKHRPALGGITIGHVDITAGTLGCIVQKESKRYILSNNHVLANSNEAGIGDAIIQPGSHDKGVYPNDHIADLYSFVPIDFMGIPSECPLAGMFTKAINSMFRMIGSRTRLQAVKQAMGNLVDAAIALPLNDEDVSDEIMEIGKIAEVKSVILGMKIKKSGRTTGLTQGEVTQVDVTVNVQYEEGKIAQFDDQLMAGAMSAGGDSGSAVLTEDNELCGLLFAGSDTTTLINRIEHVFGLLDIHLEGKN